MNNAGEVKVTFGYPEVAQKVYEAYGEQLDAVKNLEPLIAAMFSAAEQNATDVAQKIICALVRITADALSDVVLLAGNGSGPGAMKIARGMFEWAVTAEYLRLNPAEAVDFRDYGCVQNWTRYQLLLRSAPEKAKKVKLQAVRDAERKYNEVIGRFTDKNGRVRKRWNKKTLADMARDVGRGEQYDTPYSLAASLHHGNFEGISAHFSTTGEDTLFYERRSLKWVQQGLVGAHVYMLQALSSLNDAVALGFDKQIEAAAGELRRVWDTPKSEADADL